MMENKFYDTLKKIALIFMPAAITCYIAISTIWHLPYTEQISGSLVALNTFLGAIIQKASNDYHNK